MREIKELVKYLGVPLHKSANKSLFQKIVEKVEAKAREKVEAKASI